MTIPIDVDLLAAVVRRRGVCLDSEWFSASALGDRVGDRVYAVVAPRQTSTVAIFDAETGRFVCWAFRVPTRRSEVRHA